MIRALLTLLLCLGACAPRMAVRDPQLVERVWTTLHPASNPTQRLTASFSLNVDTPERTGRMIGQLWGYPLSTVRLDLTSGTGASVAMIRETPDLWMAFIPSENKAYHHELAQAGLALFHIPVPFTTAQVSSLLVGDLGPVLGNAYSSVRETKEGGLRFTFPHGDVTVLETTADQGTLTITGRAGWSLICEKPYDAPAFPSRRLYSKLTFSSPVDGSAVLRIKTLDSAGAWQDADLDLHLPQDVQWMRISSTPN